MTSVAAIQVLLFNLVLPSKGFPLSFSNRSWERKEPYLCYFITFDQIENQHKINKHICLVPFQISRLEGGKHHTGFNLCRSLENRNDS